MTAKEILKKEFGADAQIIKSEIKERVNECLEYGGSYSDAEEILMEYGLEADYIFEFL